MKAENVNPELGVYSFGAADKFVELAQENNMFIIGHTLV